MKRNTVLFLMTVVMILSLMLVGCQQGKNPAIKAVHFTEKEKELLSSVGVERYFAFDIDLSQVPIERFDVRVDHYESGKLIETSRVGLIGVMTDQKQRKLIWSQVNANNSKEVWMISVDMAKYRRIVTLSDKNMAMSWDQVEVIHTVKSGEDVILAAIVGTTKGHFVTGSDIILKNGRIKIPT